jgi:hypothetical protein
MTGLYWVYGSESIHRRAVRQGVYSVLRLFSGMGHQFDVASPQMDTAEEVIGNFLGAVINCDSGTAGVILAPSASALHQARTVGWLVMRDGNTIVLQPGVAIDKVKFYDCHGRIVDLRPRRVSNTGIFSIRTVCPGMYFAMDQDDINRPAIPLHIYR